MKKEEINESSAGLIAIFLIFSGLIYLLYLCEFQIIDETNKFESVTSKTIFLTDFKNYNPKFDNHFVIAANIKPEYRGVTDPEFSLTAKAAFMTRKYYFCQWNETIHNKQLVYKLGWSEYLINSSKFHSKDHENPVQLLPHSFKMSTPLLGIYQIQPSFFTSPDFFALFIPDEDQIKNFEQSKAYLSPKGGLPYRYINNGTFYRPINPDKLNHLSAKTTLDDIEECEAGDVLLKFQISNPKIVSIGIPRYP